MASFKLLYLTLIFCSVAVMALTSDECPALITFNAGLTPKIGNYTARKDAIPQALLNEDVDVLCLQEYWYEEDVKSMLDKLQLTYPYHYSPIQYRVGDLRKPREDMGSLEKLKDRIVTDSACSTTDIAYFNTVVLVCAALKGCMGEFEKSSAQGAACVSAKCGSKLRSKLISADCVSCITIMAQSPTDAFSACYRFVGTDNRFNTAGLVLLSKKPLSNVEFKSYFPGKKMSIPRGYIKANVQDIGQVVCTHMTAVFPFYLEYDLPFANYTQQLQAEVRLLNQSLGTPDHVLAGDLNMGPGVDRASVTPPSDDVVKEQNPNYELLLSYGYQESYIEQDGRCTYCVSNPLIAGSSYNFSHAIDHVLVMGNIYQNTTATRVLDQSSPFVLSDHYGVKAELCST